MNIKKRHLIMIASLCISIPGLMISSTLIILSIQSKQKKITTLIASAVFIVSFLMLYIVKYCDSPEARTNTRNNEPPNNELQKYEDLFPYGVEKQYLAELEKSRLEKEDKLPQYNELKNPPSYEFENMSNTDTTAKEVSQ